jgi:hypothetical protein
MYPLHLDGRKEPGNADSKSPSQHTWKFLSLHVVASQNIVMFTVLAVTTTTFQYANTYFFILLYFILFYLYFTSLVSLEATPTVADL